MRDSIWFRIPFVGKYFEWLEGDSPTGLIDGYPVTNPDGESEIPGVFIAGDLRGTPLLKFASESGDRLIQGLIEDGEFQRERSERPRDTYDLIIIGAGISGISAAISAKTVGLHFLALEADREFATICNFPAGKPIAAYPLDRSQTAQLKISGDTKEELLKVLQQQVKDFGISIIPDSPVIDIKGTKGDFQVQTEHENYKALRIVIATGKSGESRKLGVPGEELGKVQNRLIDPMDYQNQKVLVVGGGDSAVESALLLSEAPGTEVTLSYRGQALNRPKVHNIELIKDAISKNRIRVLLNSSVERIEEASVKLSLRDTDQSTEIRNNRVLILIGKKLPIDFFKKIGISIEGSWNQGKWMSLSTLLFFTGLIYFGKSAPSIPTASLGEALIRAPWFFLEQSWEKACIGILAWLSFVGFFITGIAAVLIKLRHLDQLISSKWNIFRNLYFLLAAIFISFIYITDVYTETPFLSKSMGFWYTFLYSLTILLFGIRRIVFRRSRYITLQTSSLISVQIVFLFLLPEFVFPWMGNSGMLNQWVMDNLFPNGSYWRSYGFILAWPLFFSNLFYGNPTTVWLLISLIQTFVIIPALIFWYGKGAYCGWICSCGGLAETLGEEYRRLMPHGSMARSLEHVGQVILLVVVLLTLWNLLTPRMMPYLLNDLRSTYRILVDLCLAGVLGVGAYFFLSGRVWCRFFCPLAALMHIYNKFSKYRIFSDKKKCISCGICSRTCHMGIDVMNFANKGRPMDDYECVRCSACIVQCPVDCLRFGMVGKG